MRIGSQTPRVANFPPYPLSAAPEIIDLAESAGLVLDPWQRYVLTHGLGQDLAGQWNTPRCSVWVPRQNGKGAIIEALELAWLFLLDEELIIHSAHQHRTSQRAYRRLEKIISGTAHLRRRVRQFRLSNGEQQIELWDGRLLQYTSRSSTALRGYSAPKVILDEAQELDLDQMAAILPTVSAMENWQLWFFGTPPNSPAAWCYNLRDDGEAGLDDLAHFDWGADLKLDDPADKARAMDPDTWYATNPALGVRITEATVRGETRPSGLGEKFPQERLGVWQPRAAGAGTVIAAQLWRDLVAAPERTTDRAFGVAVAADRSRTAIVGCGPRADGRLQLYVAAWRDGTGWVPERLAELHQLWRPVATAIQDKGPSATLLDPLARLNIAPSADRDEPVRGDLAVPWAAELGTGYGLLIDALRQRTITHLDEPPLNLAVAQARTRPLGTGTAFTYDGEHDALLIAASMALWAWTTRAPVVQTSYDALQNIW